MEGLQITSFLKVSIFSSTIAMSHSKHFLSDYHYYIKKIAVTLGCPIQLNGVNGTVRRVNRS